MSICTKMIRRKIKSFFEILRNILCILIIVALMIAYSVKKLRQIQVTVQLPIDTLKYIVGEIDNEIQQIDLPNLAIIVNSHNSQEQILNVDMYGEIQPDTVIMVINLYKLSTHFRYFLVSLSQVRGIEQALIVFSHSHYDENLNRLIRSIDFCRVLQIYYPYSLQLYPSEFPGTDLFDCPHEMDIRTAEILNCTGALTPDIHGHYRQSWNAERKHHWWWTANKVFDNLSCTENHNGIVIFLEDDLYLMQDFIYMTLYMKKIAKTLPQCELISFGTTTIPNSYESIRHVEVMTWDPKYHSVLAFDLSVWNIISSHYDIFCDIDDYTWTRSLFYLSLNRRDGKRFQVMTTKFPRAFKLNSYEEIWSYSIVDVLYDILDLQKRNYEQWFPPFIELYTHIEIVDDDYIIFEYVENKGGWNDPRDKQLCINITAKKIRKVLLDMEKQFKIYED